MQNEKGYEKIRALLSTLSTDRLYANFAEMPGNCLNPDKSGIYDVFNSSVGPFMLMYRQDVLDDTKIGFIDLRIPQISFKAIAFDNVQPQTFRVLHNFMRGFRARPSIFAYEEAFDKFYHIMSPMEIRKAEEEQLYKACAISKEINDMIEMGRQNTKVVKTKQNDVVSVRFPNGGLQRVIFSDVFHSLGKYVDPNAIQIEIPAAGFTGIFNKDKDHKNKVVYDQAKEYLECLKTGKEFTPKQLFDCEMLAPVRHLRTQFIRARGSGKSK